MVQWLGLHLPMQGVWVQSLVGELRPHMPPSWRTKRENRSNIVTNSIKALKKWSTSKKKKILGKKKHISVEAKHRFSGKLNYKDGFHVLHRKYLPTRRKRFGIQTRGVCTRHLCKLKPGQGMVNMLVQRYQHCSIRDSDISKGVTTQRRRKNNQFLAGQEWGRKDGWDVKKKMRAQGAESVETQKIGPFSSHHYSNWRLCWVPWIRCSLQTGF